MSNLQGPPDITIINPTPAEPRESRINISNTDWVGPIVLSCLAILLIFLVVWFLMVKPLRQQAKDTNAAVNRLGKTTQVANPQNQGSSNQSSMNGNGNNSPANQTSGTPIPSWSLAGVSYPATAWTGANPARDSVYDPIWTASGWLWQHTLAGMPDSYNKLPHDVAINLSNGSYSFDGIACDLYLDEAHQSLGDRGTHAADHQNDKTFYVQSSFGVAWALVKCEGGESSGFSIQALDIQQ